ncbi:MAG: transcriptional regulator [Thermoprotei archaeon]|nr:MAG: transcriptional regulator [Thermoprotei archaeon]RLF19733.1 MAG: transcriptional regulator [Thermoprotei archaeon]
MRQEELAEEIERTLKKEGFEVKYCEANGEDICFDIVARRENKTILVKAVDNVDTVTRVQANDMKKIAYTLKTAPLIVGLKSRRGELIEGVVYERYGIRAIRLETFSKAVRGRELPIAIVKRGGILVKINGDKLRRARLEMGLSLGEIASRIGVTRKAIYEYERGNMYASLEVAIKLEEELSEELIEPIDVFGWECREVPKDNEVGGDSIALKAKEILERCGFDAVSLRKAPFNIAASDKEKRTKIVIQAKREINGRIIKKARLMLDIAKIVNAKSLIVVGRSVEEDCVEGVPVFTFDEFSSKTDLLIEELS